MLGEVVVALDDQLDDVVVIEEFGEEADEEAVVAEAEL